MIAMQNKYEKLRKMGTSRRTEQCEVRKYIQG